jgi:hypothetical protein
MVFTIEEDEEIDYTTTPLQSAEEPSTPPPNMKIVINTFQEDNIPESTSLLGDRVVGTVGFCGAVALLSSTCCCFGRGCHTDEIAHTFNKHTLFGLCCPIG